MPDQHDEREDLLRQLFTKAGRAAQFYLIDPEPCVAQNRFRDFRDWAETEVGEYARGAAGEDRWLLTTDYDVLLTGRTESAPEQHKWSLERLADLAGYLLSRRMRDRVFAPTRDEVLQDQLEGRREFGSSKWALRWISLCCVLRLCTCLAQCLLISLVSGPAEKLIVPMLPERWRVWWLYRPKGE